MVITTRRLYVMRMRLVLPLLLLVPLAACSSSDKPDDGLADKTSALRSAVQSYSDAYLTGDGAKAYGLLSARCREGNTSAQFSTIVDQAGELYGSALPIETFDADVSGDMARVTYTYSVEGLDQKQEPWVLEDGAWHEDDC